MRSELVPSTFAPHRFGVAGLFYVYGTMNLAGVLPQVGWHCRITNPHHKSSLPVSSSSSSSADSATILIEDIKDSLSRLAAT